MRDDAIECDARRKAGGPTHKNGHPVSTLPVGVLFAPKQSGSSIWPGIEMGSVVSRIHDYGVVSDTQFVQQHGHDKQSNSCIFHFARRHSGSTLALNYRSKLRTEIQRLSVLSSWLYDIDNVQITRVQMEQSLETIENKLAPLDATGWLSEQSNELQCWFATNGSWRDFSAGQSLYRVGDTPNGMYGLGRGAMDIEYAPEGVNSFVIIRAHPGGWMGQGVLIPMKRRPVNLVTPVDSRVYFVSRQKLRALLSERPDFWPAFYALAVKHMLEVTTFLCEALSLTPTMRLARLLLRLSANSTDVVASQKELGVLLHVPRSSLRRAINQLKKSGAIHTRYGKITVTSRSKLEKFSCDFLR